MEAVLLALVCLSPWAFGAVHPLSELVLYAGVAVLVALWGVRLLLEGRLTWQKCPVVLCLATLFLLGVLQMTPLPRPALETLAPGAARTYDEFLPARPEQLPLGEARPATPGAPAGTTLSLYPGGTRQEGVRLLAVLLVFAVVRNNLTSVGVLRRLAVAAVLNGVLLSFFALLQFFTSPQGLLYWSIPSQGRVYGPFICRNHFPFYVNLCVGLGLGLLLSLRPPRRKGQPTEGPPGLLQQPKALWIVCGLGLMVGSEVLSLSRGGFLALAGGFLVCVAVKLAAGTRGGNATAKLLLVPAAGLLLVAGFGLGLVEARLGSLWQGDALHDARLPVWSKALGLVPDFPCWGTGYGSFPYAEPLHRAPEQDPFLFYDHAHNEYLEALVEGGVVRLAVSVLAVALVFALSWRALRRQPGGSTAGLVLGALTAFTTAVIHSFVEFGLHTPAIALLLTVLAAQLSGLGSAGSAPAADQDAAGVPARGAYTLRLHGMAPLLGASAAVLLSIMLVGEGWRAYQAERQRLAALHLTLRAAPGDDGRALACLKRAAWFTPENALLQLELAEAYHRQFLAAERALDSRRPGGPGQLVRSACVPLAASALAPWHLAPAGGWFTALAVSRAAEQSAAEWLARAHLLPALRHYLLARDLCPLLSMPHVRLATYRDRLQDADPCGAYLKRAKRLLAGEPDLWYVCGLQELRDGQPEEAWKSWRRCLECSARHLRAILKEVVRQPGAAQVSDRVLPDRPPLLLAAARSLVLPEESAHKERLLARALALIEGLGGAVSAEECGIRAEIHVLRDQPDQAITAYEQALEIRPDAAWRFELARLLRERGRLQQARRELRTLLAEQPGHAQGQALYQEVVRVLAEDN
jgi:O-antigen ligase